MSLARCTYCEAIVDTDDDPHCYYDDDINPTPCTCEECRSMKDAI